MGWVGSTRDLLVAEVGFWVAFVGPEVETFVDAIVDQCHVVYLAIIIQLYNVAIIGMHLSKNVIGLHIRVHIWQSPT